LTGDYEVQNWVKEMAAPLEQGCGFLGMPEKLTCVEQLVEIVTAVISICSMGHAAANFQQYQAYAFPPNYSVLLTAVPPKCKVKYLFSMLN
jgi:arachidonate 5-lipoxygenase